MLNSMVRKTQSEKVSLEFTTEGRQQWWHGCNVFWHIFSDLKSSHQEARWYPPTYLESLFNITRLLLCFQYRRSKAKWINHASKWWTNNAGKWMVMIFCPEMHRIQVESGSCMSRVEPARVKLCWTWVQVPVQQIASHSLSPCPGVCGSSPNLSPMDRKFPTSKKTSFIIPLIVGFCNWLWFSINCLKIKLQCIFNVLNFESVIYVSLCP